MLTTKKGPEELKIGSYNKFKKNIFLRYLICSIDKIDFTNVFLSPRWSKFIYETLNLEFRWRTYAFEKIHFALKL